jgi:SAM-dependent methyltransferase
LGISDRHHFDWLTEALAAFEAGSGRLAALAAARAEPVLWCLAGQRLDPPLAWLTRALGPHTRVEFFDRFPAPGSPARAQDLNALAALPAGSCDVLTLFRGSLFIEDPPAFLASARRLLRPGGLFVVDWLHGLSGAPVLDLRGAPRYDGVAVPFRTTYVDPELVAGFPREFAAFLAHVNRPPVWADVEVPGRVVALATRARRLLGRRPRARVAPAAYVDTLRAALAAAGKHLVEPPLLQRHFRVLFRHARYFYPKVRKFNLYVLTVLEPVGA